MIFEDIIMLTLNVLIATQVLDVPILKEEKIDKKPIYLQFATTLLSIVTTCISLSIESKGLSEPLMEFIMTSVKAK